MFYLTTHSANFIYSYMRWRETVREDERPTDTQTLERKRYKIDIYFELTLLNVARRTL